MLTLVGVGTLILWDSHGSLNVIDCKLTLLYHSLAPEFVYGVIISHRNTRSLTYETKTSAFITNKPQTTRNELSPSNNRGSHFKTATTPGAEHR